MRWLGGLPARRPHMAATRVRKNLPSGVDFGNDSWLDDGMSNHRNRTRRPAPQPGPFSDFGDQQEAFIDAVADAGLEPADEVLGNEHWAVVSGWDAARINGADLADSVTLARLIPDERCELMICTPSGVIMHEASFGLDRLGFMMLNVSAAVQP